MIEWSTADTGRNIPKGPGGWQSLIYPSLRALAEGVVRGVNEEGRPSEKRDLTIDSKEKVDRLQAYCDAHPFASFGQAVKNLYLGLQP